MGHCATGPTRRPGQCASASERASNRMGWRKSERAEEGEAEKQRSREEEEAARRAADAKEVQRNDDDD